MGATNGRDGAPRWYLDPVLVAAFTFVFVLGLTGNLVIHLLGVTMMEEGAGGWLIGTNTALQAAGVIAGSFASSRLAQRVGLFETLVISCTLCSFGLLALPFLDSSAAQVLPRMVFSVGLGISTALVNFIVTSRAPTKRLATCLSLFALTYATGTAAGPLQVALLGGDTHDNLILCTALLIASGTVFMHLAAGVRIARKVRAHSLWDAFRIAPIVFLPALAFGFLDNGFLSLLGPWAMAGGDTLFQASLIAAAGCLGVAAFQLPIGLLGDRISPRMVLLAVSISVVSLLMSLGLTAPDTATVYLAVFAIGGLADGLYTIGLADMTKRLPEDHLAAGNSCFVAICGLGEILGPSMAGAGLQVAGQQGLSLVSAVAMLALLAVAALLSWWKPSPDIKFAGFLPVNQAVADPEYHYVKNPRLGVANEQDR